MPDWSPDGERLAFVSRRTGGYRIYTIAPSGSGLTQVSGLPYSFDPVWSPDGTRIAFDADGSDAAVHCQASPQIDYWADSWFPTQDFLVVSELQYQPSGGYYYLDKAFTRKCEILYGIYPRNVTSFLDGERSLFPTINTSDAIPPHSAVKPRPSYNQLHFFEVEWENFLDPTD